MAVWQGSDLLCVTTVSIRLRQFAHVASDNAEVGEVLLHTPILSLVFLIAWTFLQINSGILLHHLLQRRGLTGTAAFADDEFVHRDSDGLDERRPDLQFPHRVAVTVELLEPDYAQAYAVDNDSVDAEGALIAPSTANVEALWLAGLDLVFFTILAAVSSCSKPAPGTRRPAEPHGASQEICPDQNLTNCSE